MVELIIGSGTNQISLDLTSNTIDIALQYSVDDVRKIESKNSNYSKNIKLPGTKKNNDAFGNLFDVNSTFDVYDVNKKIDARIVENGSLLLGGYLQLISVTKNNSDGLQGGSISYNVIVFDNSVDFFQTVGDKLLRNLDLADYNHTYEKSTIQNAWYTHTSEDIYQYPLLDKSSETIYLLKDFKPCFYHKGLLNKIATEAGYTLSGSFMDNTTYENELILWDGDEPKITDENADLRSFSAGMTGGTQTMGSYIYANRNESLNSTIRNSLNFQDITDPFFDNTGDYTFDINAPAPINDYCQWEVANSGNYSFTLNANINITYQNLFDGAIKLFIRGEDFVTGDDRPMGQVIFRILDADTLEDYSNGGARVDIRRFENLSNFQTKAINNDISVTIRDVDIPTGAKVVPTLDIAAEHKFAWLTQIGAGGFERDVNITLAVNPTLAAMGGGPSNWENEAERSITLNPGDNVEIGSYLPNKIKQKDLFSDIIKRYNVYITPDVTNRKNLILQSRDDYYNTTTVLDWTQKKDYSQEDNIKFLNELQNKEILFTYKADDGAEGADGNKYYGEYSTRTGDIYGQKKLVFDNEFVKDTKTIESIFSSAPLVYRGSDTDFNKYVVVPAVKSTIGKRNPVLALWGGNSLIPVKKADGTTSTLPINWGTSIENISLYPYAGHYDNPYTPTVDIHFGEVTFEYYGRLLNNIIDKNLFNIYWRNYTNQISNGKLVTSYFYLTETDINFIKDNLNARIFVKDSYYNINKIIDYKPLEAGLTKVELLKIDKGSTFESTDKPRTEIENYVTFTETDQFLTPQESRTSNNNGPFQTTNNNRILSRDAVVVGENNYVGEGSVGFISGNNNIVGPNVRNFNINGDDNTIESGVENVVINGDNENVIDSNTIIGSDNILVRGSGTNSAMLDNTGNDASGDFSFAIGFNSQSSGQSAFTSGDSNIAAGDNSFSIGFGGQANAQSSFTSGNGCIASDNNAFAIGDGSLASGNSSFSSGSSIASGNTSFAAGDSNTASGFVSFVINGSNTASGQGSFAGGDTCVASNFTSFVHSINSTVDAERGAILGGGDNTLSLGANNSVIIGGNGITGTATDTAYVPNIVITENIIPTSSADTAGEEGQVSFDASFMYYKSASGWRRVSMSTF